MEFKVNFTIVVWFVFVANLSTRLIPFKKHFSHRINFCILLCACFRLKQSNIMSWQLNPQLYLLGAAPKCTAANARLSPLQNAMCTNGGYMDHMSSVNVGLLLALNECNFQFSSNTWNCSSVEMESLLEGIKDVEGE